MPAPLVRRVLRDPRPLERMLFDRCLKEAVYYIDEVSDVAVSPHAKAFFADIFSKRLAYDEQGWLTFDGKKLANIKDGIP